MLPASHKTAIIVAGALLSLLLVVGLLAIDALLDSAAFDRAEADLLAFRARMIRGRLDRAAPELRNAMVSAEPVLDGWWPRHAWTRLFCEEERSALRAKLDASIRELEQAIEARAARIADLRSMREAADYAVTLAELDAIEARRRAHGPRLASDDPAADTELVAALAARRLGFEADIARNRATLEAIAAARERARGDDAALQAVADAVLPVPARAGEDDALAGLRESAAAERAAILASGRIEAAEREGASAATAAAAAAAADRLERDPDLRRGATGTLAGRREAAIVALRRRQGELEAWERSVRRVDDALEADEPGAAARAIERLAPCDARSQAEAERLRAAFGRRALDGLLRAALGAIERSDTAALGRLAAPFAPGGAVRPYLDGTARADADRVRLQVDRACDRDLYEQFRRRPSAGAAERYLAGWPAVRRAMAPAVQAWRRAAAESRTTIALQELRWGTLGLASVNRGLEDRPDAEVAIFLDGARAAGLRVSDIREHSANGVNDVALEARGFPWDELEVGVLVKLDLRDAILADPRPRGAIRQPVSAWRADRASEVEFTDPAWAGSRHVAVFRVTVPGTPPLPPFHGRPQ